jgi:predicted enzyme related to lactoylglutathione lyase
MAEENTGRFVWYELITPDPKSAIAFYTDVVGWKTQPFSDEYTMWVTSQGPIGGTMTLTTGARNSGAPPSWMASIQTDNVDATVAAVQKRNGRCHVQPMDIPNVGRYAVVQDPQGAAFALFKPETSLAPHNTMKPGEFNWNELLTTDHEAAFRFYSELFAWQKLQDHDMGPMGKYLIFGRGDQRFGGMFTKPKDNPAPPMWLYYVEVGDLDGALARAKAKGAQVINGPMEVPGGSRIVQLIDPQGAAFALHENSKTAR